MNEIERATVEINSIMKAVAPKTEEEKPAPKKQRQKKAASEEKK